MSDFDLVAIGFEHVGILHGHCFPALATLAKSSTAFPWTHMVFLSFSGTTACETLEATPFFPLLIDFFYKHIGTAKSLLKNRPNTPKQFRLGSGQYYEAPRLCQKADI